MNFIVRKFFRLTFYCAKFFLKIIANFNHRLYMRYYVFLLDKYGMKFTGFPRYIGVNVMFDDFEKISLGDRVVISDDCHFLTHDYSLTTALISIKKKPKKDLAFQKPIIVGDNVFIGKKSIIMPNARIGSNVIIGAGAVVRGEIPENTIAIGNPCKVISKLDVKAKKWLNIMDYNNVKSD